MSTDLDRYCQILTDLTRSQTDQSSVSRKGSGLKVSVMFESQLWLFISFPTACSSGLNAGSIHICDQVIKNLFVFTKLFLNLSTSFKLFTTSSVYNRCHSFFRSEFIGWVTLGQERCALYTSEADLIVQHIGILSRRTYATDERSPLKFKLNT